MKTRGTPETPATATDVVTDEQQTATTEGVQPSAQPAPQPATAAPEEQNKQDEKPPADEPEPTTLKVRRTNVGAHPLHTLDREWEKFGDEGEMAIAEALVRIEHGFFEAVDQAAHVAALENRMAALRAADAKRIAEATTK